MEVAPLYTLLPLFSLFTLLSPLLNTVTTSRAPVVQKVDIFPIDKGKTCNVIDTLISTELLYGVGSVSALGDQS